jgi:DNA-directed RNA polymerase specialized sigma24 family protein
MNGLLLTIAELLEEFNELQRVIITLRLEGYSVQEISNKCQRSKRTVERELQTFRLRLAQEFAP